MDFEQPSYRNRRRQWRCEGVATGSAKITFTTKDGSIVSSQVTVTVTAAS
jgi:uncharacterized protein YjdB